MSVTGDAPAVARAGGGESCVWLIYALMALHAVCYQSQVPLEPYLVDSLVGKGVEATATLARLQSFHQVAQLVGCVAFGGFLDRYGCRAGLLVSYSACAVALLLLSQSSSIAVLFLSKVPAICAHPYLCSQTALSQLTPEGPARVAAFGKLVFAYTIGGVIGPLAGGSLGRHGDFLLSAKIAVFGSMMCVAGSWALPTTMERHAVRALDPLVASEGAAAVPPPPQTLAPWRERAGTIFSSVGWLIAVKLVVNTASGMTSSAQAIVLKDELMLSQADMGVLTSCQFAFFALVSGVFLGPLTRCLGGRAQPVVMKCLPVIAVGYFFQAVLRSKFLGLLDGLSPHAQTYVFISASMFCGMFSFSLGTSLTTESTQLVPKEMKGTLLGMEHSMYSVSRVLSPPMGIGVLNHAGSTALYSLTGAIYAAVFLVWCAFSSRILRTGREFSMPDAADAKATASVEMKSGVV